MRRIERYMYSVAFVTVKNGEIAGETVYVPVGTAFVAASQHAEYAVTAGHVVSDKPQTYLRLRTGNGGLMTAKNAGSWGVEDVPVTWTHHDGGDSVDLAATPLQGEVGRSRHRYMSIKPGVGQRPRLADRVYYMGLLEPVGQMGDRLVPFIRSGTIGALDQEGIPVQGDGTMLSADGHILDCHGQGGFSGAPVFSYRSDVGYDVSEERARSLGRPPRPSKQETVSLLGVFLGYYRDSDARGPINTGIGVVSPVSRIRELMKQIGGR